MPTLYCLCAPAHVHIQRRSKFDHAHVVTHNASLKRIQVVVAKHSMFVQVCVCVLTGLIH